MRKRIIILGCFVAALLAMTVEGFAQPGRFNQNYSRQRYFGLMADSLQSVPKDTFRVNVNNAFYKNYSWIGSKNNMLFLWDTANYKFNPISIDSVYVRTGTDSVFSRFYGTERFSFLKTSGAGIYVDTVYARNDSLLYKKNAVEFFVRKITDTENVQDAVGAMINASLQYVDGTPLLAIGDRDFGDITTSGSGLTWTIDNNVVTYEKMQNISATDRILGRVTTTGDPEELNPAQVTNMLDLFTATTKGLVPASGGGTTNYLRADGTWTTISVTIGSVTGLSDSLLNKANRDGSNAYGTWAIDITGNAATVTNGVYTTGSYANPSWITSLAWSKITGTPTTLSGYGITDALSTTLTNGNFLVGNISNIATSVTPTGDVTFDNAGVFTIGALKVATGMIQNSAVTLAKMADVATATVFYRKTAGTGAPEVQTLATLKTDLGLTGTNSGDQTITLTSDVTGSGTGSFATTIANNVVTYAKMQQSSVGFTIMAKVGTGAGNYAELAAGTDAILMRSGSGNLTFGTIVTNQIGANQVTFAKFVQGAANTVVTNPTALTADFTTTALSANTLLGMGSTGNIAAITLGTNLSMSGTVLNATGGGSGHTIKEEGVALTARTGLNFIGLGITATDDLAGNETDITLHVASASQEGVVSTGTQTFAGAKTFNGQITGLGKAVIGAGSGAAGVSLADGNLTSTQSSVLNLYGFGVQNEWVGFGQYYDGLWKPTSTSAFQIYHTGTNLDIFGNEGLTANVSYTPTRIGRIKANGNVSYGDIDPANRLSLATPADDVIPALGVNGGKLGLFGASNAYGMIMGQVVTGNGYIQVQRIDASAVAYNLLLQPSGGEVQIRSTTDQGDFTLQNTGGTYLNATGKTISIILGSDATGDIFYRNSSGFFTRLGIGNAADVLTVSGGLPVWSAPGGGTAHNILSATHTDATIGTVARGDLITGQTATPAWTRLAKGTANQIFQSDGTDIGWVSMSGDATLSAGAITLGANVVTLAKFQQIATASFLGRVTAATGNVEVLTGTQATTLLDVFTSGLKGVVPASGGGTANFLRADGTWAAPAGGGDMVLASVQTNTGAKTFLDATLLLRNVANTFSGKFTNTITADRTYTLQDASGTIAFLSDITTPGIDAVLAVGQALTTTRTITTGAFSLFLTGSGLPLSTTSTGGSAAQFKSDLSSTNTVEKVVYVQRGSTGTPAIGIGASVAFSLENSSSTEFTALELKASLTGVTAGSESSQFVISGINAGTTEDRFTLTGAGKLQLNKYGVGTFTGTGAYTLQVDASGNVIEAAIGGGSGLGDPGANGIVVRTALNTTINRTLTGTANRITITNGDGVSGNPTFDIGTDVVTIAGSQTLTNKTLTSPVISSITNTGTLTLPTVTGTLVQKSFASITSNATWSPQGDASVNYYDVTAQAIDVTAISAPSGTPTNGNELYIRVVDNNTARAISGWNAAYAAGTNLSFPTTTTSGKYMVLKFVYNTMNSINKWQLVAVLDGL